MVGCGGIGGVIAATLVEQGQRLTVVTRRAAITEAIRLRGFDLRDELGQRRIRGEVELVEELPVEGSWDFVFLAVPPTGLVEAARGAAPLLAKGGALVCFQNGLAEERLARIVGPERVIGAVVAWGASSPDPGVFERTSAGGFTLGRLDGEVGEQLESLGRILEAIGPVELSTNLRGARWSKLALNCAVSSLGTIGGDRLGVLMRHRFVRRLALEVMTEAVVVARAEGVRLEKVAGTLDLEWVALTDAERSGAGSPSVMAKHALLLAVGARYRRLRSSMLAAIERGREPPVDYLNGEVVDRAMRHGIGAPLNARIRELVHAIARREERSEVSTLRRLYDETRYPGANAAQKSPPPA
ncbi:ketopantoate reductase family protein [Vulgatibacter incomptus]|uniref:ketopantoate reductase family protein n=1 Tax=Vulgatibacter incomptus TaxID=1391653 RepID=UPI0023E3C4CA|nr:2-dehydropantoate 2-reductase [Vulgatibacter incomptus]